MNGRLLDPRPQGARYESPQFLGWIDLVRRFINAGVRVQRFDPVATTSGTSVTLASGIVSWAEMIVISFSGISTNGTSDYTVQLNGESSGYAGHVVRVSNAPAVSYQALSAGFDLTEAVAATSTMTGELVLRLIDRSTNTWVARGNADGTNAVNLMNAATGSKALTDTLSSIVITTLGGADTFDAGSAKVTVFGWS